jgi:putative transcriptional regulator
LIYILTRQNESFNNLTNQEVVILKLGNSLKRCRFDFNDMTQEELAQAVGVTRQTIISIEKGRFVPSPLLALKL